MKTRQRGQALVEYALILALIALAVIVALRVFGEDISRIFSTLSRSI